MPPPHSRSDGTQCSQNGIELSNSFFDDVVGVVGVVGGITSMSLSAEGSSQPTISKCGRDTLPNFGLGKLLTANLMIGRPQFATFLARRV